MRQWAICVFDDLIEFTGPDSARYAEHFIPAMAASLLNQDNDVRQSACYGCGVAALYGGPAYLNFCKDSLPHLFGIINAADSRSEENILMTENAISAVGKILRAFKDSGVFDSKAVTDLWFAALPITEDEAECVILYQFLCDLLDSGELHDQGGTDFDFVKRLVGILSAVLVRPSLLASSPELMHRLAGRLKDIIRRFAEHEAIFRNIMGPETHGFLVGQGLL